MLDVKQSIVGRVKWLPHEIDAMNMYQQIQVLNYVKDYCSKLIPIATRADEQNKKLEELQKAYDEAKGIKKFPIATGICAVLLIICVAVALSDTFLISFLANFPAMIMLVLTVIAFIMIFVELGYCKKSIKKYNEQYGPEKNKLNLIIKEYFDFLKATADDCVTTTSALPAYHDNIYALDFMIQAITNHRAANLQQAINLYEKHEEDLRIRGILEEQLAAQRAAAASSAAAAAAARDAATSAKRAEYNSYFR